MRQQLTAAQFSQGLAIGFRFGHAARQQLCVVVFEILRQFLNDGGFARRREPEVCQPPSDLLSPLNHSQSLLCFLNLTRLGFAELSSHSSRSAAIGSTWVARRAGPTSASSATVENRKAAIT